MITDVNEIKKLRRGELVGIAALVFCGLVCAYFIICFSVAQALDLYALRLSTLIAAPVLLAAGVGVAAFCNIKFGGAIEKIIADHVQSVFIDNAALMHPERDSLTYYISPVTPDGALNIKTNNFKETINFDFSAFGKLSPARKSGINSAVVDRLCTTFMRLYARGRQYGSVAYRVEKGAKSGRTVYIIENGEPDSKAYKKFLRGRGA